MLMLNKQEIKELIEKDKLIEGYIDLETQLTPNGFDLTVYKVFEFASQGSIDFSNKERVVPGGREIFPRKLNPVDKFGWWTLRKGAYRVKTNEVINLANDLIALAYTRTSLLRAGVFTQHGVWDAGFKGAGEFILVVESASGARIKQNARVAQLVFSKINPTEGYDGVYKES